MAMPWPRVRALPFMLHAPAHARALQRLIWRRQCLAPSPSPTPKSELTLGHLQPLPVHACYGAQLIFDVRIYGRMCIACNNILSLQLHAFVVTAQQASLTCRRHRDRELSCSAGVDGRAARAAKLRAQYETHSSYTLLFGRGFSRLSTICRRKGTLQSQAPSALRPTRCSLHITIKSQSARLVVGV